MQAIVLVAFFVTLLLSSTYEFMYLRGTPTQISAQQMTSAMIIYHMNAVRQCGSGSCSTGIITITPDATDYTTSQSSLSNYSGGTVSSGTNAPSELLYAPDIASIQNISKFNYSNNFISAVGNLTLSNGTTGQYVVTTYQGSNGVTANSNLFGTIAADLKQVDPGGYAGEWSPTTGLAIGTGILTFCQSYSTTGACNSYTSGMSVSTLSIPQGFGGITFVANAPIMATRVK
jgi:hypothetical protein